MLLLCVGMMSMSAQNCTYNPDSNANGTIDSNDLLAFLEVFGQDFTTTCLENTNVTWDDCPNPYYGEWMYISMMYGNNGHEYYLTGTGSIPEPNINDNYAGAFTTFNGYATGSVTSYHIQANNGGVSYDTPKWYAYDCEIDELATCNYLSNEYDRWEYLRKAEVITWYADQGMYIKMQFVLSNNGSNSYWFTFYRPNVGIVEESQQKVLYSTQDGYHFYYNSEKYNLQGGKIK